MIESKTVVHNGRSYTVNVNGHILVVRDENDEFIGQTWPSRWMDNGNISWEIQIRHFDEDLVRERTLEDALNYILGHSECLDTQKRLADQQIIDFFAKEE